MGLRPWLGFAFFIIKSRKEGLLSVLLMLWSKSDTVTFSRDGKTRSVIGLASQVQTRCENSGQISFLFAQNGEPQFTLTEFFTSFS